MMNALRALNQIMPALKRAAISPEKFSERERSALIGLLNLALLADDTKLSGIATDVVVALEGENQRQDCQFWPTGE